MGERLRRRFLGLAASAPLAMATGCEGCDGSPSTPTPSPTATAAAGWDVAALQAIPGVEFENTSNLGSGSSYALMPVPDGGRARDRGRRDALDKVLTLID